MKKLVALWWGWMGSRLGGYGGNRPLEGPSAGLSALGTNWVRKVQLAVARPSLGPAIDNDSVVAMWSVGCALAMFCHECVSHEFEGNQFGPCDVSTV
jgi:hypothetical protein